jgi:uncharacterized protein YvpB
MAGGKRRGAGVFVTLAILTMVMFCDGPLSDAAVAVAARPDAASVLVKAQWQKPELYNGCEVTSLSMLLSAAGAPVDKRVLAREIRRDPTLEVRDAAGRTVRWGNPHQGFVGDVTGAGRGYGVYHGPVAELLARHLPGRSLDMSGGSFDVVLDSVAQGRPVVVWTTTGFFVPGDWVVWNSPSGLVRATFSEHAVLVVGYSATSVEVADPLDGQRKWLNREGFRRSWEAMGRQAVTYR